MLVAACASFVAAGEAAAQAPSHQGEALRPQGLQDSAAFVHIAAVKRLPGNAVAITLRIDRGFHVNANPASMEYLIPTAVAFAGAEPTRITYPKPVRFTPKFSNQPLSVYEGGVTIVATFPGGSLPLARILRATVTVQACTDSICLPPADLPVSP